VDNNPFYEIRRGVTRLNDDGLPIGGWNPSEKLYLKDKYRRALHILV